MLLSFFSIISPALSPSLLQEVGVYLARSMDGWSEELCFLRRTKSISISLPFGGWLLQKDFFTSVAEIASFRIFPSFDAFLSHQSAVLVVAICVAVVDFL